LGVVAGSGPRPSSSNEALSPGYLRVREREISAASGGMASAAALASAASREWEVSCRGRYLALFGEALQAGLGHVVEVAALRERAGAELARMGLRADGASPAKRKIYAKDADSSPRAGATNAAPATPAPTETDDRSSTTCG
jgi:hypothetical protein